MTAALRLYEVVDALEQIGEQLIDNGGELTPEITAQLDALEGALAQKVERTVLYLKNVEAIAAVAENEAQRLFDLAKRRRSVVARLKDYLKAQLERAGVPKVETALVVARIQKNSRPSISCTVPLEQLPEVYVRVRREFNGEVAYELWKARAPLAPGIEVVVGSHLRIQ